MSDEGSWEAQIGAASWPMSLDAEEPPRHGGDSDQTAIIPSFRMLDEIETTPQPVVHDTGVARYQSHVEPRDRIIRTLALGFPAEAPMVIAHSIEAVIVSRGGGVMIVGWVDDAGRGLDGVTVVATGWRVTFDGVSLARCRRRDVEAALGRSDPHPYGFLGFVFAGHEINAHGVCEIELRMSDGGVASAEIALRSVNDDEIRNILLSQISGAEQFGDTAIQAIASLDRGMGAQIIDLNKHITAKLTASPYVERFGSNARRYAGSIIVCLYGRAEYHFIQSALFSGKPGADQYEWIYVSNSPELAEPLLASARLAHRLYGVDQTLVLLPGNAGFGAANNIAAAYARSDRIMIVNPDVFPKDPAWAAKHTALLAARPRAETDLFGVPLYYDDGSLMHGGMQFEMDTGLSFDRGTTSRWQLLRVEHYGKGAAPDSTEYTMSRPVPAVTGAFISITRPLFETVGGFSEEFVFGHYEDADLCLKGFEQGVTTWMHDLRLWHLEGKGSTRLPVHEGGSLVNRWHFSSRWGVTVNAGLLGRAPHLIPRAAASLERVF